MGQREDVSASLTRGDSRDGCARRLVVGGPLVAGEPITAGEPVAVRPDGKVISRAYCVECGAAVCHHLWRARLANVERMLADAQDGFGGGEVSLATIGASKALADALAEVRAMIDGAE